MVVCLFIFDLRETQEYIRVTVRSEDLGKVTDCWETDTYTHMLAMSLFLKAVCVKALHKIKRILPPLSNTPVIKPSLYSWDVCRSKHTHMHTNSHTHKIRRDYHPSRCKLLKECTTCKFPCMRCCECLYVRVRVFLSSLVYLIHWGI